MEPLIEIPQHKWPDLRDLYRTNWPQGADGYCFLDTQISCPGLTEAFNIKIYSPNGDINNGTIAISDWKKYQVFIFPIKHDLTVIENSLLNSKIIDWNRYVNLPSVKTNLLESLKRISKQLDVNITFEGGVIEYVLHKDTPLYDIRHPSNTYVGPLKPEYIDTIDKSWTFHSSTSSVYFNKLMDNNCNYVLYSSDHEPAAWINIDEAGALSHLYCVESQRNKGLAA
ncbi:uncharacterized protein ACR2FA_005560 [Aphomia sociella]